MILTLRTDKPESELGLYEGDQKLAYYTWHAHRQLAETIHQKINDLLTARGQTLSKVRGVVVYEGPGSFTGLRIGVSVANALAYSLGVPIIATTGDEWIQKGIESIKSDPQYRPVAPDYGAAPHITQQRK